MGSEQISEQGVGGSWAFEGSVAVVGQLGAGGGTRVEAMTLRSGLGCQFLEMGPCRCRGRRKKIKKRVGEVRLRLWTQNRSQKIVFSFF